MRVKRAELGIQGNNIDPSEKRKEKPECKIQYTETQKEDMEKIKEKIKKNKGKTKSPQKKQAEEELENLKIGWLSQAQKDHLLETERLREETTGSNVAYIAKRMLRNFKIELGLIEIDEQTKSKER